jgi:hypothetical protein
MFSVSTPEIDAFESMYNAADKTPVLVASDSITSINVITDVDEVAEADISVFPNPTRDGIVRLTGDDMNQISSISIFDARGKLVFEASQVQKNSIQLPAETGVYVIRVEGNFGRKLLRVLRN